MYLRITSWKLKDGKTREAVALCKELLALGDWPGPMRVYTAETGQRDTLVWAFEAEDPGDLHDRARFVNPGKQEAFSTLWDKWNELIMPGTMHDQIWQQR
jgi:hypothetical protein